MSVDLHDPASAAYKKAKRQYLNSTRNKKNTAELDWTPFRAAEKRFKARFPPPNLSDVLDLALLDDTRTLEIQAGVWKGSSSAVDYRELSPKASSSNIKAYTTPRIPGLVLLPGFLAPQKQRELVQWSLADHARHPNETNLDIHYVLPEDGLWNVCERARDDPTEDICVQPRASTSELPPSDAAPGPRQLVNNTPATPDNFLALSATPKPPSTPSTTVQPTPASALLRKLRWANIGWYYHWGTKQYDFTKGKGKIDDVLVDVCQNAVNAVDWDQVYGPTDTSDWGESGPAWKTWSEDYEPDAGIVNFYQTKDTLMAHVDRSEVCATSPLVSISLGNAAVFLIGGLTRDTEPIPIILRSGDVVIMSGPACRRAYHGVPRILENTLPDHLAAQPDEPQWAPFAEYMDTTRININVRQVFPKGFDPVLVVEDSNL
ncbi:hypothetical protein C8F04DRAFT_1061399 [Mycena alexandri]|uniref:Fe2OG dioxygenase domain-containing protein n=1 Tax=Mycena alexandri TaxID=1745969 RepID=A0AAD6TI55_9AGAR|nr:hypothetical protein C8F04DRAFT_1061399 [Mycena alexandri]